MISTTYLKKSLNGKNKKGAFNMWMAIGGVAAAIVLLFLVGLLDPELQRARKRTNARIQERIDAANKLYVCSYNECLGYSRYWQVNIAYFKMLLAGEQPKDRLSGNLDAEMVCPHCQKANGLKRSNNDSKWLQSEPDCLALKDAKDLEAVIELRSKLKREIKEKEELKEFQAYQDLKEKRRLKKHHEFQGSMGAGKKTTPGSTIRTKDGEGLVFTGINPEKMDASMRAEIAESATAQARKLGYDTEDIKFAWLPTDDNGWKIVVANDKGFKTKKSEPRYKMPEHAGFYESAHDIVSKLDWLDEAEKTALSYAKENSLPIKVEGDHLYILEDGDWKIVVKEPFNRINTLHNNARYWNASEYVGSRREH